MAKEKFICAVNFINGEKDKEGVVAHFKKGDEYPKTSGELFEIAKRDGLIVPVEVMGKAAIVENKKLQAEVAELKQQLEESAVVDAEEVF